MSIVVSPPPNGNVSKLFPKNIRLFTDSTFLVAKGTESNCFELTRVGRASHLIPLKVITVVEFNLALSIKNQTPLLPSLT